MGMFDFELDPLTVGDTSTLGLAEQEMEAKVNELLDILEEDYSTEDITTDDVESFALEIGLDVLDLPQWLYDKLFEVVEE